MLVPEVSCPKCGSYLISEDDCYDWVHYDEGLKELYGGHCDKCGAELQWSKIYKFIGFDDIEED